MNLVQIDKNTIVDKDKVYALIGEEYNGKSYTYVRMMIGDEEREFLVKENVKDVGALLMETENNGRKC